MTPTPSAVRRRTTSKSVSISSSSRIADGSSMISSFASPEIARAIETICCAAGRSALTFARGGMAVWPRRSSSAVDVALHRGAVEQQAPARLVAEEDRLGDGQVLDEVELLVDRRDAARQRAGRVAGRQRLAREEDLAGGRLDGTGDALDQRRLAGAVGAEQAVDLAGPDVEVDALQRLDAGVLLDEVRDLEDRGALAHPTTIGRRCEWAMRRPCSVFSGVPPQTGSSCSTRQDAVEAALVERVDVTAEVDVAEARDPVAPPAHVPRVARASR